MGDGDIFNRINFGDSESWKTIHAKERSMTDSAIRMMEAMWSDGVSQREICQEIGIPPRRFDTLRKGALSHLPARKKGFGGGSYDRNSSPPDLMTIAKRSAEVRAKWSDAELLERTTSVRQTLVLFDPIQHEDLVRSVVTTNATDAISRFSAVFDSVKKSHFTTCLWSS